MISLGEVVEAGVNLLKDDLVKVLQRFVTDPTKMRELDIELQRVLQGHQHELETTLRATIRAKERIMVAELTQGDTYTKRARPTVVYAGLVMLLLCYVLPPYFGMKQIELPPEFFYVWGGIVSTWIIGRSAERKGAVGGLVGMITGNKRETSLVD